MGRLVLFAAAAVCAALAAGCGAADRAAERAPVPAAGGPATVERTDGRLGDAVAARPDGPIVALSRGGRPSLRADRDHGARRDGVAAGAACPNPAPAPDALGAVAEATLCLLNGERVDHGLAPLWGNEKLGAAASAYAADLVAGSYFSHTGRDGSDVRERIERSGYLPADRGWRIGENLAWGTGELAMPASIVQAWMNSPGHRDNILNPAYREIGIGIVAGNPAARNGAGATYATEFGVVEAGAVASAPRKARPRARKAARHRSTRKAVKHRKARVSRRGGKGGGRNHRRVRSRGPKARISI
jgi:uncharacterized protein YkwD